MIIKVNINTITINNTIFLLSHNSNTIPLIQPQHNYNIKKESNFNNINHNHKNSYHCKNNNNNNYSCNSNINNSCWINILNLNIKLSKNNVFNILSKLNNNKFSIIKCFFSRKSKYCSHNNKIIYYSSNINNNRIWA